MTNAEKESALRKINERALDIARRFGTNSGQYKSYLNAMTALVGKDNIITPKKRKKRKIKDESKRKISAYELGAKQMSRGKKVLDKLTEDEINAMLSHQTAAQIQKSAEEEARRESAETGEHITAEEVLDAQDYVENIKAEHYDEFYDAVDKYWDVMGGKGSGAPRPSYKTIESIIKAYKAAEEAHKRRRYKERDEIEASIDTMLEQKKPKTIYERYM